MRCIFSSCSHAPWSDPEPMNVGFTRLILEKREAAPGQPLPLLWTGWPHVLFLPCTSNPKDLFGIWVSEARSGLNQVRQNCSAGTSPDVSSKKRRGRKRRAVKSTPVVPEDQMSMVSAPVVLEDPTLVVLEDLTLVLSAPVVLEDLTLVVPENLTLVLSAPVVLEDQTLVVSALLVLEDLTPVVYVPTQEILSAQEIWISESNLLSVPAQKISESNSNMSQNPLVDFEISDSDDELVLPSPTVRRSSRLLSRDSPWARWPSEKIISTLEAAGIPFNTDMPRQDLLLLASNILGCPPSVYEEELQVSPGPPKQTGGKRSAKSSPKAL
ncbi:hypothetical protein Q8A67_006367 [Cirrhinus molitorella]|uniref:Uncharacterized protein n=1 Tax=Cirrhinus molitorella TaxID=172907 RepID=A0AA88Q4Y9_9TELE|nr:hypothetical protein Q8A67_006367 [Cirrhinus molitorella]